MPSRKESWSLRRGVGAGGGGGDAADAAPRARVSRDRRACPPCVRARTAVAEAAAAGAARRADRSVAMRVSMPKGNFGRARTKWGAIPQGLHAGVGVGRTCHTRSARPQKGGRGRGGGEQRPAAARQCAPFLFAARKRAPCSCRHACAAETTDGVVARVWCRGRGGTTRNAGRTKGETKRDVGSERVRPVKSEKKSNGAVVFSRPPSARFGRLPSLLTTPTPQTHTHLPAGELASTPGELYSPP